MIPGRHGGVGLHPKHAGKGLLGIQATFSYMGSLRKVEKENMSHGHHRGRENVRGQGGQSTEEWGYWESFLISFKTHNNPLRATIK